MSEFFCHVRDDCVNFASGPFCQTVARLFEFLLIAPGYQDARALLEKLPRGLEADAARAARHDCATTFDSQIHLTLPLTPSGAA